MNELEHAQNQAVIFLSTKTFYLDSEFEKAYKNMTRAFLKWNKEMESE